MQRKCRTSLQFQMTSSLLSPLLDSLWRQRVWWDDSVAGGGVFFSSSFNSLTDISACIFGHLSLMTAVCPLQEHRRRFWFWWRAADCRVGPITLLPQSCLCVDWGARYLWRKIRLSKLKLVQSTRAENHLGDLILMVCQHQWRRLNKKTDKTKSLSKHTRLDIFVYN